MNNLSMYIGPLLIFGFILMRMLRETPLKESYRGSLIIIIIGVVTVVSGLKGVPLTSAIIFDVIFASISGLMFGLLRGTTFKVYFSHEQNTWVRKGSWLTLLVFFVGIIINELVAHFVLHGDRSINGITQTLHMGLSIIGRKFINLQAKEKSQK